MSPQNRFSYCATCAFVFPVVLICLYPLPAVLVITYVLPIPRMVHRHNSEFHSRMYARDATPQVPPRTTVAFKVSAIGKTCVSNHLGEVTLAREAPD